MENGIAVVIVNYRTAGLVVDCLRSLAPEIAAWPHCRVTVVDNASADGSAEFISQAIAAHSWAKWAMVLPLDRNGGFAAGNNAALRPILAADRPPDYVWLLNPDTLVHPGAGRALVDFLERHPRVGLAGSRLEDTNGAPQRSAFRFPSVASEWESTVRLGAISRLLDRQLVAPAVRRAPHAADWLSGASVMVRQQVFRDIGLLDEGYFLYFEDLDFCRRARRAGWRSWYVPSSLVVHLVSRSTGLPDHKAAPQRLPSYWFASRRRYFAKERRPLGALCADLAWSAGFASWRLRRRLQRKPDPDPPRLLTDFVRYSFLERWV